MTLGPFRFTIRFPGPAASAEPSPPALVSPLLALMRSDGGRRTARGWASLAGLRLSVVEAQLQRLRAQKLVTCSAQLWEPV